MFSLTVIIPAYKEADNLRILLPELLEVLGEKKLPFEIIIVDMEHAVDDTEDVCKEFPNVRCIKRIGEFYGDAIRSGIACAENEKTLIMDADGSHSAEYFDAMLEKARDFDLVIGSRYVRGGSTQNPLILIFMSWVVNVVFRMVLGVRIRDISNSFRIYDTAQLKSIELKCINFDIVEEILIKLFSKYPEIKYIETPICFQKRNHGKSKRNLFLFACSYLGTLYKMKKLILQERKRKNFQP